MTALYSGDSVTFPDATIQVSAQVGVKNRVMNGGFVLNQRVYVSGTALASGSYGHDRFKGGASGGTYTFTQGSLGVNTTATITAGSLIQVIEGCNVAEGGTYILSWTGTAQGRLNSGTYGASGTVTVTGWVAGTNLPVEFNTGTVGNIQLEKGLTASTFDYRPYGTELSLCQRYYSKLVTPGFGAFGAGFFSSTTVGQIYIKYPMTMRTLPSSNFAGLYLNDSTSAFTVISINTNYTGYDSCRLDVNVASGGVQYRPFTAQGNGSGNSYVDFSAEL